MTSKSAKAASVTSGRQLRITRRSRIDDFGLPPTAPAEAEPHRGAHRIIEAFVRRRLKSPVGQETFRCATEVLRRPIYTLHAGADRGATWHEWDDPAGLATGGVALDIVWLLGARANHDYESLCSLGDDLLPAKLDYDELFDAARLTFAHAIISEVSKIRRDALANPGRIRTAVVAGERRGVRSHWFRRSELIPISATGSWRPAPLLGRQPSWPQPDPRRRRRQ